MPSKNLNPEERRRLTKLEKVIGNGLAQFVEVGRALLEVQAEKLYRQHHATFPSYCEEIDGTSPRATPIGSSPPQRSMTICPQLGTKSSVLEVKLNHANSPNCPRRNRRRPGRKW